MYGSGIPITNNDDILLVQTTECYAFEHTLLTSNSKPQWQELRY